MELLEKLTSVVTEHFCEFSLQSDHSASSLIESSSRQQEQFNKMSIAICQQLSELLSIDIFMPTFVITNTK